MYLCVKHIFIEFIHLIASESNEICDKETKKTIAGEHVISALQTLGFEEYVEEVEEVYKDHKKQQKVFARIILNGNPIWRLTICYL